MNLESVHPEVVATAIRVLGEDQRKRDEGTTVVGPGRQRRQRIEPDVVGHNLRDGATTATSHPDPQQRQPKIAGTPQLGRGRGQNRLHEIHQTLDQALWALTKRPARRGEQYRTGWSRGETVRR